MLTCVLKFSLLVTNLMPWTVLFTTWSIIWSTDGLAPSLKVLPDYLKETQLRFKPTISTLPEQIHLSLGSKANEMVVIWATADEFDEEPSFVHYGLTPDNINMTVTAEADDMGFLDNEYGTKGIFRGIMTGLSSGRVYYYYVVTDSHSSPVYQFRHIEQMVNRPASFIIYGDLGKVGGSYTVRKLKTEAISGNHDVFIHVGDFAYNFDDDGGRRGDDFMNRIQDIATRIPYMTCPGNHEIKNSFHHYRHRFSTPKASWPIPPHQMWYSFDVGLVHFISYSTEAYFAHNGDYKGAQYKWLSDNLQAANRRRDVRPWIIAFGHRPMYCSNTNRDDCTKEKSILREEPYNLEKLFYTEGVDLIIQAHEHSYERFYPLYNDTQTDCDYTDPSAPVHVISGAAGCNERELMCADVFLSEPRPFSAKRSWLPGLNGYGRLKVHNSTYLTWQQVLSISDQPLDQFSIVQHIHGRRGQLQYNEELNCD